MKIEKKIRILQFCLLLGAVGALGGCGSQEAAEANGRTVEGLSRPEAMILVATERNRYEQIYTDQIWNVTMPESGESFEDFLLEQVKQFASDLKVVGAMAGEYGIELDSSEKEQVRRLAEDYYSQLTAADVAYTGAVEEDAYQLYLDYALASKTVSELTKDAAVEISDSQAKVIEIQQIILEDKETADQVLALTGQEGADFASIAGEYGVQDEVRLSLGRGEADAAVEEAAFSLEEGQISPVIQASDGRFYIIQCINTYDQEATASRKAEMALVQKDGAFRQLYDEFLAEHPVEVSDTVWDGVSCVTDQDTATTNFFELYEEYFPE